MFLAHFITEQTEKRVLRSPQLPVSFQRINHFTPDGEQRRSSLREVWKPEENKTFQLPLCLEVLRGAEEHKAL